MGTVKTTAWEELYLEFDDGTGTYTHYAGMVSKSYEMSSDMVESDVPDTDESLPAVKFRGLKTLSETISGPLTFIPKDYPYYRDWQQSGDARNVRISITKAQADGGGQWTTAYVLNNFKISGEMASAAMTAEITLNSSGKIGAFVAGDHAPVGTRLLPTP